MHVAFSADGDERELDIDLGSGHGTIGDLVAALGAGHSGLLIDGAYWAPETPLAEVPLRQGAVLRPAAGPEAPAETSKPVTVVSVAGGIDAGRTVPLAAGAHTIGRGPDADVALNTPTVDPVHAHLKVGGDGAVVVADAGSTNGVVVEGYRCREAIRLEPGQIVQAGAALLRTDPPSTSDAPGLGRPRRNGTFAFNRPPRVMVKPTPRSLRVPDPPKDPGPGTKFNLMAMLAPVIFGAGSAILMKNMMMASFALLSPVMMASNKMEEKRTAGKERARGNREFNNALLAFRQGLLSARQAEVARRRAAFPDPAEVLRRAEAPSVRLWERRPGHDDFLQASVGHATLAWTPMLDGPSPEQPPEVDEAVSQLGWLPQAPLVVDLQPGRTLGVVGDRKAALALARQTICQLAVHHGPADLRIAVVTEPAQAADWEWVKWLPHVRSLDEASGRSLLAAKPEDVVAVLDELGTPPAKPASSGLSGSETPTGPVTLLVVDSPPLLEGRNSPTRDVLTGSGVPASGLVLVRTADQLPAVSTSIVELDGVHGRARYREPALNLSVGPLVVAGMSESIAAQCCRRLASLEDPEVADVGADLPSGVALVDLVGGDITPTAISRRWKAAGTVPRLNGPIGVAGDGPLELDLVSDGPHALIAGTTGAGKSELLRSMVAGLAATVDSEHLNFVLIDYKGGSAFAQCADLPHTVGMVTDLDEHLGARALRCLEAELHYRERRLRDAGASDLKEYLKDGHREPLPRLVVIIDEFATMAAELPDFIDSLVGIAQRGRSLGVHMILATQRPGGAVNDNIRANTNLRISLRVQDPAESSDIIGSPLASSIGRKQAGRGYVRLGASEVFPFQAALVTGVTRRDETVPIKIGRFVFGPDPVLADPEKETTGPAAAPAATGPTDLEQLVAAAAEAARSEGLAPPRRPWPETLPATLSLDELAAEAGGANAVRVGAGPAYALADDPDHQRRALFAWSPTLGNSFVCGVSGSGTTDTLGSIAIALAREYPPERLWIYGFDFGTQALSPLAGLPHCGGVIGSSDRERQFRLVRYLADELERRRRHVAASGAVKIDPADPASPFPAIVVLIDNYGALYSAWDDGAGMSMRDILTRTIADGPGLGVVAVISTDRPLGLPGALGSVVPNKMALRLADPSDLTFFGLNPRDVGKLGFCRGVDAATKLEVQVAVAHRDGLSAAVSETVAMLGAIEPATRPPAIGTLPDEVPVTQVAERLKVGEGEWFLPFGISDNSLAPSGLRVGEGEHVLIVGAPRSGKSTTLDAVAAMVGATHPEIVITAIALRRSPLQDAAEVRRLVKSAGDIEGAVTELLADAAPQLVLIDDADAVDDTPTEALAKLVSTSRTDVHLVVAGRGDALRSNYIHWSVKIRSSRQGLALKPDDMDANLWNSQFPREKPSAFPAGRGYLVVDGVAELIQAARRD